MISLYDYQLAAVNQMHNGCILCGGVGSGKSRTALAYYYILQGGDLGSRKYTRMKNPKDLYIITTAKKRDSFEWEGEMAPFLMSPTDHTLYSNKIVIDSWNNISKYKNVKDAFFIFDEQRVVGTGAWVKAFLKMAKSNEWILLSATPGDTWQDYIPVFIANGFYENKTQFNRDHIIFSRYTKYPKVDRYINTGRLLRLRNKILVDMDFERPTTAHRRDIFIDYDVAQYKRIIKERWNYDKDEPFKSASELCYALRKCVNSDYRRAEEVLDIVADKKRVIIFYNFDYELEILRGLDYRVGDKKPEVAEWNGHKHQPIPESDCWVYLVNYTAGAEGWNCIKTDTIIFYSQNYSYKTVAQSEGRIARVNTPFKDLYYYHLKSRSSIDLSISKALENKKNFNEGRFIQL